MHILAETCCSNLYMAYSAQYVVLNLTCVLLIALNVYNIKFQEAVCF